MSYTGFYSVPKLVTLSDPRKAQ